MGFLEKLLDGARVEWQPLGEVIALEKGQQLNKKFLSKTGLYPAYNGGVSYSGFTDSYNYNEDTITISQGGASAGFVNFITSKFYANAHCYVVLPNVERVQNRYIYHFLKLAQKNLMEKQHGAGIPALRTSEINSLSIPIPCPENPQKSLKIQGEIVRILDKFTELTTELKLRKKQYQYYRDKLLSFPQDNVTWKALGEIGEFIRGNGLQKKDFVEDGFPAIHYGQIYTRYGLCADKTFTYIAPELANRLRKAQKNDLLLATTSENDEDVVKPLAWLGGQVAISGDMMLFRHEQNVKYLAYFFQTEAFQQQKRNYITGTKVRRVSSQDLAKIKIPVPSLEEQSRIVAILDRFETLTNSLQEGLPREITLRKKQYAYYRDMLFNFPKN